GAKNAKPTVPHRPATRRTPTTSNESSKPNLYFRPTPRQARMPPINPNISDVNGFNAPAAGVMVTRPATSPEAAPSEVAALSRIASMSIQPNIAAAAAAVVLIHASPAKPSAAKADPPLNPNQPNHNRAAPSIVSGRLCGRDGLFGKLWRLPTTKARTQSSRASRNMDYYPACEINRNHICFTTSGSKQQSGNRLRRV